MKLEVVFIDIDGTIANNFFIHTKGWDAILSSLGKSVPSRFYNKLHGESTENAIIKLLIHVNHEFTQAELLSYIDLKNSIRNKEIMTLDKSVLFPHVVSFFEFLKKHQVKLICAAITTKCREIVERLQLTEYFYDFICGNDMYPLKSESSSCYLQYIKNNFFDETKCIVIDDDLNVIRNLKKSGIKAYHFDPFKKSRITDGSVSNFLDLKDTINKLLCSK